MRKEMVMGYRCDADKVMEIKKIQSFRSKATQVKSLFGSGVNKRKNILPTWHYLFVFILLFFFFVTSGHAMNVSLQWIPNNELNLAGYKVFYRQEGQSYNYTNPYWETTDPTCTVYDLDKNKTYYFMVRAFSTEGFQSGNSNEVCLKAGTLTGN